MTARFDLTAAIAAEQTALTTRLVAIPHTDLAARAAAQNASVARIADIRAAWAAGKPCPSASSDVAVASALVAPAVIHIGLAAGQGLVLANQSWGVQSGTPDGVAVGSNGAIRFRARTGEHASFDEPRKIRAELAGSRQYAKGETIHLAGTITVDLATAIAGSDWCSIVQIHQADTRRADGSPVAASPLFGAGLILDARGSPVLQIGGETGTGVPALNVFSPTRILGRAPFAFDVDHRFELTVVDGHGGPGRIRFVLDGNAVCDFAGPTGYEYVDRLADAFRIQDKPQATGSYLKLGIYAGKFAGKVPPAGVSVSYTVRDLRA